MLAANGATHNMAQFLTGFAGIPLNDASMDDYLAKPIRVEELVAALGNTPGPSSKER